MDLASTRKCALPLPTSYPERERDRTTIGAFGRLVTVRAGGRGSGNPYCFGPLGLLDVLAHERARAPPPPGPRTPGSRRPGPVYGSIRAARHVRAGVVPVAGDRVLAAVHRAGVQGVPQAQVLAAPFASQSMRFTRSHRSRAKTPGPARCGTPGRSRPPRCSHTATSATGAAGRHPPRKCWHERHLLLRQLDVLTARRKHLHHLRLRLRRRAGGRRRKRGRHSDDR